MAILTIDDDALEVDESGTTRCCWVGTTEIYADYHDQEWGRPVADDQRLFEKLCLEGFQAGLSWLTILRKREAFRSAFAQFDIALVADFTQIDVDRLVADATIVRHRGKIESTINNAQRCLELIERERSLSDFVWSFAPLPETRPNTVTWDWLMNHPTCAESLALSKELKRRGWSFVGPTTVYAFMQSMGLVNDHQRGCFVRREVELAGEERLGR